MDVDRFGRDDQYKINTLKSFVHTLDTVTLNNAVAMGTEYGVTKKDLYLEHLQWLIVNHQFTLDDFKMHISSYHNQFNHFPLEVISQLENSIYDEIQGDNYNQLLFYYDLLTEVYQIKISQTTDESLQVTRLYLFVTINTNNKL